MLLYFDFNVELSRKFRKIELMIYDHFTYAIVLLLYIEILYAMSFLINLIKIN